MTMESKRFSDFGPFRVDRQKRLLMQDSNPLPLPPKALDVLIFLIDNRGRAIEKAEFMRAVWPDSFVEEGNLSQNIFLLRKTLGDGQDGQRYILTVPGVGYRFVPGVTEHDGQPSEQLISPSDRTSGAQPPLVSSRRAVLRIVFYGTPWF
jgi:DNA-binding winged helix-turn-helix (wHTH) protein